MEYFCPVKFVRLPNPTFDRFGKKGVKKGKNNDGNPHKIVDDWVISEM